MKDYKQTADSVLQRVHEYEQQNGSSHAKVRRIGKVSVIVLPVLALAAVGIFALSGGFGGNGLESGSNDKVGGNDHIGQYKSDSSDSGNTGEKKAESSSKADASSRETVTSKAVISTSDSVPDGVCGNNYGCSNPDGVSVYNRDSSSLDSSLNPNERFGGQTMIAAIPKNNRTQVIGEKITEEEARDYFLKNAASLESSLAASGVEIAEISYDIAQYCFTGNVLCAKCSLMFMKGYCHVSYDGNTDESKPGLTVKQNFMDFHVYNADRLVAIVTLVKENGLITATPAFGAPWFDSFNNALNKYHGQKVLFLYAGAMAYAIAPDNTVIHPQGYESSVNDSGLKNVKDAYNWFYDERCVYTP